MVITNLRKEIKYWYGRFCSNIGNLNLSNYASIQMPEKDVWGLLMTKDDPLAKKIQLRLKI